MAVNNSQGGRYRSDHEIEKYRLELNWTKILDKLKTSKVSEYAKFLEGEAQLELYLQQYPLTDSHHIETARESLTRIEHLLKSGGLSRTFEGQCLVAKLYYAQGRFDECLTSVDLAINSIPNENEEEPHRSSLLLAEVYSLKGLLLEKKEGELFDIIKAFDDSCKLSKTYYAEVEKAKNLSNENLDIENSLIEIAYQRLPLLHAANNNVATAIEIFRSYIQNVHIKSLETMRQTLIKQYAQLLIKCVCKGNYPPINGNSDDHHHHHHHFLPHRRNSQPLFVPRDVDEEILLLLLLGQSATLNEAVLDWQPEYEAQRERSHQAAYNILSLLAIFLSRKQAFHLIAESYEQALRFSFEHFQTWYNYGLALISSGQSFRAYLILKECLRMQPQNIQVYLQLSKIILQYIYDVPSLFETFPSSGEDVQPLIKQTLNQQQQNQFEQRPPFLDLIDEAINYCQQAKELQNPPFPRSLLLLALAQSFKARQTSIHQDRQKLFQSAIKELRECVELDPYDSIAHFHLAQNLSFLNQTDEALKSIETCLLLSPDDKYALHLHTLLLTAKKQIPEAYAQIYRATNDYPDINLLLTKASIEEELYGCEQSIVTCKEALILWKTEIEPLLMTNSHHTRGISHSSAGNRTIGRSQNPSINTEGETEQNPAGVLKVEDGIKNLLLLSIRTSSGLANDESFLSNNRSSTSFFSIQPVYFNLIQIFEHLVRYYIKLDKIDESERCLKEISPLSPFCHQMFYLRGLIYNARGQLKLAKQNYNDALAINPFHYPTLIQLTKLLIQIGNYSLAEKYARDAISIQPSNYQPWYLLSLSMEARGEYEQSVDVGATAVHLEGDSPIVSYHSIIRVL